MDSPMLMATMEEDKDMISSLKRKESDLDKGMISSSKIKESEEGESKFDVGDLQTNLKKKKKNLEEEEEEDDYFYPIPDEYRSLMSKEAIDDYQRLVRSVMDLRNPEEEEKEEEKFDYTSIEVPVTDVWEDCEDFKRKGMTTQGCTNYGA